MQSRISSDEKVGLRVKRPAKGTPGRPSPDLFLQLTFPMEPKPLKIAIDVDGVITEAPQFFAALSSAVRSAGHTVYVLSDYDEAFRDLREEELAEYGIEYDELILTRRKTEYFEDLEIDFAIDDEAEYYYQRHSAIPLDLISAANRKK